MTDSSAGTLTGADRAFLSRPLQAWVTTLRPDGSPHNTVVWLDVDGGDVVFTTLRTRAKARNLQRDPRVSLSALEPDDGYHFISVGGAGPIETADVAEIVSRLRQKYRPGVTPAPPEPDRVVVRSGPTTS